jgi:hypothetical protein
MTDASLEPRHLLGDVEPDTLCEWQRFAVVDGVG